MPGAELHRYSFVAVVYLGWNERYPLIMSYGLL